MRSLIDPVEGDKKRGSGDDDESKRKTVKRKKKRVNRTASTSMVNDSIFVAQTNLASTDNVNLQERDGIKISDDIVVEDERTRRIREEAEKKRKREEKETKRLLKLDTEARPSKYLVDFDQY